MFFKGLVGFINKKTITEEKLVTCHQCKEQYHDLWTLVKHCYSAHSLRICLEDMPEGDLLTATSSPQSSSNAESSLLLSPSNYPATPTKILHGQ